MERRTFLSVLGMTPVIGMAGMTKNFGQHDILQASSIKVIDSHAHVVDSGKPVLQMMQELNEGFRLAGFDAMCYAVNTCEGFHAIHRNLLAFIYKFLYPDQGYVFASLDYHLPGSNTSEWDFRLQAERLIEIGADGFKMYEGKPNARKVCGNIPLTSQRYAGFYDLLEKRGIPLALHIADPPEFWEKDKASASQVASDWFFADVTYSTWQEIYDECIAVIANNPKLRIILPQFGFLRSDQVEELMYRFPNLYIDTNSGGTFDHFGSEAEAFARIVAKCPDRIIFGCTGVSNDLARSTANKSRRMRENIHGLGLSAKGEADILNGTFMSLCPQKPVNKEALKRYATSIKNSLEGFPARPDDQATVKRTIEVIDFIEKL